MVLAPLLASAAAGAHDTGPGEFTALLFVFLLATFIGLGVITRGSRLLHTPLMSLTNAISAIAVVASIVIAGQDHPPVITLLGAIDYKREASPVKQWETAQVPVGWSAWWRLPNNDFDDPNYFDTFPAYCPFEQRRTPLDCKAWHNPEFRDTLGGPQERGPERKVAGENSQKYFTSYSVHEAGLYQVVSGVKPGDRLRFSVFLEGWSNAANDPFKSDLGQRMNLQAGIDPTGGNDPWSPNIIWTSPAESFDRFAQFGTVGV